MKIDFSLVAVVCATAAITAAAPRMVRPFGRTVLKTARRVLSGANSCLPDEAWEELVLETRRVAAPSQSAGQDLFEYLYLENRLTPFTKEWLDLIEDNTLNFLLLIYVELPNLATFCSDSFNDHYAILNEIPVNWMRTTNAFTRYFKWKLENGGVAEGPNPNPKEKQLLRTWIQKRAELACASKALVEKYLLSAGGLDALPGCGGGWFLGVQEVKNLALIFPDGDNLIRCLLAEE